MNSNQINYTTQNQKDLNPNYVPDLNSIQTSNIKNNSNETNPQYSAHQPLKASISEPLYSPVNIILSQINPTIPKSNNIPSPPNHNENIIQPQAFNTNTSNMIYKKPKNINNDLVNKKQKQNQIPTNNNITIPYIQGKKSNQIILLYYPNINQNIINSENNLIQNKIINESTNKNSLNQTERKNIIDQSQ